MMPWDAVDVATPHPTDEKFGVVLRVCVAVEAVDEDMVAQHLLCPSLDDKFIGILSM
jgi:hypothetical protein